MRKMLRQTVIFIALPAEVRAASGAAEKETQLLCTLRQANPSLRSGAYQRPSSPEWLQLPFVIHEQGKEFHVQPSSSY